MHEVKSLRPPAPIPLGTGSIPAWVRAPLPPSTSPGPIRGLEPQRCPPVPPGTQARRPGRSDVGSGFHTFIVKLGNNYTGLPLTAQQTNRKRTEPEGAGAVPAHARGGGRGWEEIRERERQKETEIITNQRDCARSAREGGGGGGGGAGPGRGPSRGSEAVGSGTNREKHDPSVGA